jgi:hypothetical protein
MEDYHLISWANTEVNKDNLVFDYILDIEDQINTFFLNNDLKLNSDRDVFLIRLLAYLYKHSTN